MSSTKINISPVENRYIRLLLAIENMDKEKLVDLGDSYLLKLNKKIKVVMSFIFPCYLIKN